MSALKAIWDLNQRSNMAPKTQHFTNYFLNGLYMNFASKPVILFSGPISNIDLGNGNKHYLNQYDQRCLSPWFVYHCQCTWQKIKKKAWNLSTFQECTISSHWPFLWWLATPRLSGFSLCRTVSKQGSATGSASRGLTSSSECPALR